MPLPTWNLWNLGPQGPREYVDWDEWGGLEVNSNDFVHHKTFHEGSWTGIHHSQGTYLDNLLVEDVCLSYHKEWAQRLYEVRKNNIWNRIEVCSIRDEHAWYGNIVGYGQNPPPQELLIPTVTFKNSVIRNVGGQGFQLVHAKNRLNETGFDPADVVTPGGPIVLYNNVFLNCGMYYAWERAGYAVSIFDNLNPVDIDKIFVDKSMQQQSTGLLLIEGGSTFGVVIRNSIFTGAVMTGAVATIRNRVAVEITNCKFSAAGGQNKLDFENCDHVVFTNCVGNSEVKRDGVYVGLISDNPSW